MNKFKYILFAPIILLFGHASFAKHTLQVKLESKGFTQGRYLIIKDMSVDCANAGQGCVTYVGLRPKQKGPYSVQFNENTLDVHVMYKICKVPEAADIKSGPLGKWLQYLPARKDMQGADCDNTKNSMYVWYTKNHLFSDWGVEIKKEGTEKSTKKAKLREYQRS